MNARCSRFDGLLKPNRLLSVALLIVQSIKADAAPQASPADVFAAAGLLGTWSPHCNMAPSFDNPRVTWRAVDGKLVHYVTFDDKKFSIVDEVGSATMVTDDEIMFTVIRDHKLFVTATVRLKDEHIDVVRSVGPDGRLYVDNGIDVSTGRPDLVDERCAALES